MQRTLFAAGLRSLRLAGKSRQIRPLALRFVRFHFTSRL